MIGYDSAHDTYNGYKVVRGTTRKDIDKLRGLRNTIIYMPWHAYWHASVAFIETCQSRNIEVKLLL